MSYFTCFVAVARNAIAVFTLVEMFSTPFTIWAITIGRTVQTVAAMSSCVIKSLIKVTPTGESVTIAGCIINKENTRDHNRELMRSRILGGERRGENLDNISVLFKIRERPFMMMKNEEQHLDDVTDLTHPMEQKDRTNNYGWVISRNTRTNPIISRRRIACWSEIRPSLTHPNSIKNSGLRVSSSKDCELYETNVRNR